MIIYLSNVDSYLKPAHSLTHETILIGKQFIEKYLTYRTLLLSILMILSPSDMTVHVYAADISER